MRRFVLAELRSRARSIAAITIGAFVFLFAVAATYQAFGGAGMPAKFFAGKPPPAISAFSGSRTTDLFSPQHYLALGFNHPLFLVLTLTVAISFGSRAVAGDVETGRAELVYARPVPRSRILLAHIAQWAVVQAVVVAAGVAGAAAGSRLSPDLRAAGVGTRMIGVGLAYAGVAAVFAGVAFAASALVRSRTAAVGVAVGVATASYLVNFVSILWSPMKAAARLTPFGYYEPLEVVSKGVAWGNLAVLVGVAVLLFVLADVATERRDLA